MGDDGLDCVYCGTTLIPMLEKRVCMLCEKYIEGNPVIEEAMRRNADKKAVSKEMP